MSSQERRQNAWDLFEQIQKDIQKVQEEYARKVTAIVAQHLDPRDAAQRYVALQLCNPERQVATELEAAAVKIERRRIGFRKKEAA